MAITYIHPETNEPVSKEPWRWVALYSDASELHQFEIKDGRAIFHQSKEIDASKLKELRLEHDTFSTITIAVPDNATPVHFYRHKRVVEEFINEDGEHLNREWRIKIWCIGFRIDKTYWLAFTDEYNHTLFTNDKDMFLDKAMAI